MEEWSDVRGFEGLYQVSSEGRVKSLERRTSNYDQIVKEHLVAAGSHPSGYIYVILYKGGVRYGRKVHRVVAEAFIRNTENKRTVNHKNGVKNDNRVENLEWCTQSENHKHAYATGLMRARDMRGENGTKAKLKNEDIRKIKSLIASGFSNKEIGLKYLVTHQNINRIRKGETWTHLV